MLYRETETGRWDGLDFEKFGMSYVWEAWVSFPVIDHDLSNLHNLYVLYIEGKLW